MRTNELKKKGLLSENNNYLSICLSRDAILDDLYSIIGKELYLHMYVLMIFLLKHEFVGNKTNY